MTVEELRTEATNELRLEQEEEIKEHIKGLMREIEEYHAEIDTLQAEISVTGKTIENLIVMSVSEAYREIHNPDWQIKGKG